MKLAVDVIMFTVYMMTINKEPTMNTQEKAREVIGNFLLTYFAKK